MIRKLIVKIRRSKLIQSIFVLIFRILSIRPIKKNVIVFESFLGKQFSDNPKAIYEYLKENHFEYKMYWSIDKRYVNKYKDKDIEVLPRLGLKWFLTMSCAGYWVTNSRLPLWLPKPKGTTYIQTWHGTPLKRLALDMEKVHMPGTNTERYKENFVRESSKWDYLISPNRYSTAIFKRAFNYKKTILETGYPRNDILINKNQKCQIDYLKEKIGIPKNKKIILYAPTWRDNNYKDVGHYLFSFYLDFNKMRSKLGDEYIILLRLHYLISEINSIEKYKDFVYDMSSYNDINELYLISDILITDYSSVFFDYGILKRPIIFFVHDIEDYKEQLRGFYFDLEEKAPGPLVYNTVELIKEIKSADAHYEKYSYQISEFQKEFIYLEDGESTKRIVDKIFATRK